MLKQRAKLASVCANETEAGLPPAMPARPGQHTAHWSGTFHLSRSRGRTSRSCARLGKVLIHNSTSCSPSLHSPQQSGSRGELRGSPGKENIHPRQGSGLALEPLKQTICLRLQSPRSSGIRAMASFLPIPSPVCPGRKSACCSQQTGPDAGL